MAFRVYDTKGDGVITKDEIVEMLKLMVGNNLTNEQIELIVQKTMAEYDLDGDGKISEEEFAKVLLILRINTFFSLIHPYPETQIQTQTHSLQMMEKEDIGNKMTIRFDKQYY